MNAVEAHSAGLTREAVLTTCSLFLRIPDRAPLYGSAIILNLPLIHSVPGNGSQQRLALSVAILQQKLHNHCESL